VGSAANRLGHEEVTIVPVYQSRHQPRRQTTTAGKIDDVERYDRYYDITYDGIQHRMFPSIALSVGSLVVRVNNPKYDARVIPPGSASKLTNRFSGLRLDGRAGQGALYIGTIGGVLREHAHYSLPGAKRQPDKVWKPTSKDATSDFMREQRAGAAVDPNLKFFLYRMNETLQFADLRLTSLASFVKRMLCAGGAQRYGLSDKAVIDFLARAASNPSDYSASRGIADAVYDSRKRSGLAGVCAFSSRADRDSGLVVGSEGDATGGLIYAVFGADSTTVSSLTPVPKSPGNLAFDTFAELSAAVQP
jgi:hypothetical protein